MSLLVLIALVFPICPVLLKRSTRKPVSLIALPPRQHACLSGSKSDVGAGHDLCRLPIICRLNKGWTASRVDVSYADLEAVVTFDVARTSVGIRGYHQRRASINPDILVRIEVIMKNLPCCA